MWDEIKYSVCPRPFMRPREALGGQSGKGQVRDRQGTGKGLVRDRQGTGKGQARDW